MAVKTDIRSAAKGVFEITDLGTFLRGILSMAIVSGAILTLVYLIWGAIDWLMSDGEPEKLKAARNKIIHALVGLALLALVWLIWRLTLLFLGVGTVEEGITTFPLGGD